MEEILNEALAKDLETATFLGAILLWLLVIPFLLLIPFMKVRRRS